MTQSQGRTSSGRAPAGTKSGRPALITGGAGFIGTNLAERLLGAGEPVVILDNLSRKGAEQNLKYLCAAYGSLVHVDVADVRNRYGVAKAVSRCDRVYHFAAQVAVTTSLSDPMSDFEMNLEGTVNLLEAIRQQASPPPLLFASTNRVYGDLGDVELTVLENRYVPRDPDLRAYGIGEGQGLDFRSPHGCSKGAADQYVLDYARMYGLRNVVLRMSCVYGRRQWGTEDQGWVAHFAQQMLRGGGLNVYGDGKQVRDLLYIDDLVDAMLLAMEHIDALAGRAFNVGGGPDHAVNLLDVIEYLSQLCGAQPQIRYGPRRRGDQPYYVSDIRRFSEATGWTPQTPVEQGISQLYQWIVENAHPGVGVLQSEG
ncbi:MAG: CDP-paratose 2-epimerase [Planctomycetes bacterium RBG_13_62_9]|nr:MAG: CDP-paratose 2-epimerase [Planctomycetes bacterium RBG_13_62_9]